MKKLLFLLLLSAGVRAQSPHGVLTGVGMGTVHWTKGFWAERFAVCRDSMLPHLWRIYTDKKISHAFENFRIAAGLDTGTHAGPPFHDGDFYKLLEGMAAMYAVTHDPRLDDLMDSAIAVIAKSQRADGYIHTPVVIEERAGRSVSAEDQLNFEKYNVGHLMTAACVHYRATGKKSLLVVAIRAADYLMAVYKTSSPQSARDAICPSHYMGLVELYRVTKNPAYLQLAKNLIDIRGFVGVGTDDNQDRVPFRSQHVAMGHAVRANYLYAGVADVVAETGDDSLRHCLDEIWTDVTQRKMYITGGCGALYDGVSPDAVSYNPAAIQEVHQAYGRGYQLPNMTAHNETCANIGNLLWNWRMLLVSGDSRYADVLEQALYNSVLSGVSLDGDRYFYTNPLRASRAFPYTLRWSGGREEYIALSNCCPPNLARTLAEVGDYAYCVNDKGVYVNLYGGNILKTKELELEQVTDYPWNGKIVLTVKKAPMAALAIFLRIPGWCKGASIQVNGKAVNGQTRAGKYVELSHVWKAGDVIVLDLPMPAVLLEANPLVEETKGQAAVQRGPVVYCLESPDLGAGQSIFTVAIPATVRLEPRPMSIGTSHFMALEGMAKMLPAGDGKLYQEVTVAPAKDTPVRLIPYYAWANRGASDMTVWLNLLRE
ncbi:MAG TPA: glycoside hydrolase family 127 protein [Puia sp.]